MDIVGDVVETQTHRATPPRRDPSSPPHWEKRATEPSLSVPLQAALSSRLRPVCILRVRLLLAFLF